MLAGKRLQQPQSEFAKIASAWAVELQKMEPQQQLFAKKGQMGTLRRDYMQTNNFSCSCSTYSSVQPSPIIYHYNSHSQEQSQHTAQIQQSSASQFFPKLSINKCK